MDTQKPKISQEPRITIRLSSETRKALKVMAAQQEVSVQGLLEPVIQQFVGTLVK